MAVNNNRPQGHDKKVTGQSGNVERRGEGLGTGRVGNTGNRGNKYTPTSPVQHSSTGGQYSSAPTGGGSLFKLALPIVAFIIIAIVMAMGKGSVSTSDISNLTEGVSNLNGGGTQNLGGSAENYNIGSNKMSPNYNVAPIARDKRTTILGDGKDVITIMVYMCGTDLESKHGMATSDINEMLGATLSDNINLVVYTGGCKKWKNSTISSTVNQIYQIKNGQMVCLEADMGAKAMTDPATLAEFIQYCEANFPANRNDLILWDHGGGSVTGYGYDEKITSGSMDLAGIDLALSRGGVTFDFVGFDACLMATVENALMISKYADYLIASEETEPGVGWYYTRWLTELSKNTSMLTVDIGKNIIDDFVDVCNQKCRGQSTTLSVVDLAELEKTVPDKLTSFAADTGSKINNKEYKKVQKARSGSREFAKSSKIDQIDLIDFAVNLGTDQGQDLAKVIGEAVKYNRASADMDRSYGLSVYFPQKNVKKLDKLIKTYKSIGMDDEYTRCIQSYARVEAGGQAATYDSAASTVPSTTGTSLLGSLFTGTAGIDAATSEDNEYIQSNKLDASALKWQQDAGTYKVMLSEEQWDLVSTLDLNVYLDDGTGYVDLGTDNVFSFDDAGNLIGEYDRTWFGINGQIVPFYHLDTTGNTTTGYVPALLNGERVRLIVVFDDEHPTGFLAGASTDYRSGETETIAKSMVALEPGDNIDIICDYYTYDNHYQDSYKFGNQIIVDGSLSVGYLYLPEGAKYSAMYRFTDIYEQVYWTPEIP